MGAKKMLELIKTMFYIFVILLLATLISLWLEVLIETIKDLFKKR